MHIQGNVRNEATFKMPRQGYNVHQATPSEFMLSEKSLVFFT